MGTMRPSIESPGFFMGDTGLFALTNPLCLDAINNKNKERPMQAYFEYASKTSSLIFTFVLTYLFISVIFPYFAGDMASLDVRTGGYTHAEVMAAMQGYGDAGRLRYAWISPTLDTLFPLIYASFYVGILYRFAPMTRLQGLVYIPILGGVIDLAENAQIVAMLLQYPDISVAQVEWANRFTLTKFIFTRLSMLMAVIVLAFAALQAIHIRWQKRQS
jgi:hypothetical protein